MYIDNFIAGLKLFSGYEIKIRWIFKVPQTSEHAEGMPAVMFIVYDVFMPETEHGEARQERRASCAQARPGGGWHFPFDVILEYEAGW